MGPPIVTALVRAGFDVSVITRENPQGPPQKFAAARFSSMVQVKTSDYSHSSLVKILSGKDAVVSAVGPLGTKGQIAVIDAAIEAGVKRFIPSEYGYDTPNHPNKFIPEIAFAMKEKKDVFDYLVAKQDKISWTGLGTGAFLDWV